MRGMTTRGAASTCASLPSVTTAARGNVKKSNSSHYRSRPSTLQSIKEKAKERKGPSQVYDEVF